MHKDVKGNQELKNALEKTTIIINDLNIETELIFQAIKDFLDQLSNSYEFIQTVENNITKIGAGFKFGKHIFRINITNEPEKISIEPRFSASFDNSVQQTIVTDINKVQKAVNKMFKED
jgi:deoxyxylulose-5-phosphate synthase